MLIRSAYCVAPELLIRSVVVVVVLFLRQSSATGVGFIVLIEMQMGRRRDIDDDEWDRFELTALLH